MNPVKNPVKFLYNGDAETKLVTVPKTEHTYRFYKDQPYLIKFDLDIEFFRNELEFTEFDKEEEVIVEEAIDEDLIQDGPVDEEEVDKPKEMTKEDLQKMRKSDLREMLKKLAPEKSCPIKKENIIKEILELEVS